MASAKAALSAGAAQYTRRVPRPFPLPMGSMPISNVQFSRSGTPNVSRMVRTPERSWCSVSPRGRVGRSPSRARSSRSPYSTAGRSMEPPSTRKLSSSQEDCRDTASRSTTATGYCRSKAAGSSRFNSPHSSGSVPSPGA